jgi:hypothetical protein
MAFGYCVHEALRILFQKMKDQWCFSG